MTAAVVQQTPLTPPSVSLIASAIAAQEINERWVNGFLWQPEGCGAADIFDLCNNDPSTGFSKTVAANAKPISGTPVGVVAQYTCSTFGWQAADYQARATRMLIAVESFKLAREVWEGTSTLNVSLDQAGYATTVATGVSPLDVIGKLETAFYDTSPAQRAMIHMSPHFLETLIAASGGAALRREGAVYYTWMDSVIAVDKGYRGKGPAAAAGEWVYITPLLTVRRGAISLVPDNISEATLRKQNEVTFFAERPVSATWDYECQAYTLSVDLSLR